MYNIFIGLNFSKNFFWQNLDNRIYKSFNVLNKFERTNILVYQTNFSNVINCVNLKKRLGFFKKDNKINHYSLYKLNFYKNIYQSQFFTQENQINSDLKTFNKYIDLGRGSFFMFYKNRLILKNYLFQKKINQRKTTRFLSRLLKFTFKDSLVFFEFSLINYLVKSGFSSSKKEALILLKSGKVYVNGLTIKNPFYFLKKGDVVQLPISVNNYNYVYYNFDKNFKKLSLLKHIIWKNTRFRNNFYKQPYNRVPSWLNNFFNYGDDVSSNIEIDYTTMSFCLINTSIDTVSLSSDFDLNFLNLYMFRNYNWKYLI